MARTIVVCKVVVEGGETNAKKGNAIPASTVETQPLHANKDVFLQEVSIS
jgi:hypothetical protein